VNALHRLEERARAWSVAVEHTRDSATALLGFGRRGGQPVVLKLVKQPGDEWQSGHIARAFDGHGIARVLECDDGAVLLERLTPGYSLARLALNGRDDEAIDILAETIQTMSGHATPPPECATVRGWAASFDRYVARADDRISPHLVTEAHRCFLSLEASQGERQLLHGDLHHYNVLFDSTRGWLAIDPKGVIGEVEFEIGATLRNPFERPDLFVSAAIVERRVARLARRLNMNVARALEWAFAQAVLSAIWSLEDGFTVEADAPVLRLAAAIRPMLPKLP
jgi:streptomycin 6-kinase